MDREERLIVEVRTLFNKLSWLNKIKMEAALKEYKASEVHFLEYIDKNEDINVTKLAESFFMTRSAMSKVAKKLIKKGYIESYQKPENKKEIYFKLTEQGEKINKVHEKLHNEFRQRDKVVFDKLDDEQLVNMLAFIQEYSNHLDKEIEKVNVSVTE